MKCHTVAFAMTVTMASPVFAQEFRILPNIAGASESAAGGISGDGLYVVGRSGTQAVRWSLVDGTITVIGVLPGTTSASASDASWDGSVVVGSSGAWPNPHPFRWTASDGMRQLPAIPGLPGEEGWGKAVSADGEVVVGSSNRRAAYWIGNSDAIDLTNGRWFSYSAAEGICANCSGIICSAANCGDGACGFYWSESFGWSVLLDRWGRGGPVGLAISGDGLIGFAATGGPEMAHLPGRFSWIPHDGSAYSFYPRATNFDGSAFVGERTRDSGRQIRAWAWSDRLGYTDLNVFIASRGISTGAWILTNAWGMDDAGITIVGEARLGTQTGPLGAFALSLPCLLCPADMTCDGFLDFLDVAEFVDAFESGSTAGDFNRDDFIDFLDVDEFIDQFEAGC